MKTVLEKEQYYCALLDTSSDYKIFHTARSECYRDKTVKEIPELRDIWERTATYHDSRRHWWSSFRHHDAYFLLFKKAAERELAGIADINFYDGMKSARFAGLHVLSNHRRQHLSDMLHQARINYMLSHTHLDHVTTMIEPWNKPSIEAATRNGFYFVEQILVEPSFKALGIYSNILRPPQPEQVQRDIDLIKLEYSPPPL